MFDLSRICPVATVGILRPAKTNGLKPSVEFNSGTVNRLLKSAYLKGQEYDKH